LIKYALPYNDTAESMPSANRAPSSFQPSEMSLEKKNPIKNKEEKQRKKRKRKTGDTILRILRILLVFCYVKSRVLFPTEEVKFPIFPVHASIDPKKKTKKRNFSNCSSRTPGEKPSHLANERPGHDS